MEQDARSRKTGRFTEDAAGEAAECGAGRVRNEKAGVKAGLKPGLYKLFCAQGSVQSNGAEGPGAKIHGLVADGVHECGEFGRAEESRNRFWKIGIGGSIARNKPANPWQDFTKIPAIEISQQAVGRLGEFQDGDGAAGLEHALNLAQAGFIVGEVAKAEGCCYQIKGIAGERKPESVCLKKRHWWRSGQTRMTGDSLALSA